jgi:ectoine hydroxylase-related dioxygenase (phytanoyl-CoA dioxygenase family)
LEAAFILSDAGDNSCLFEVVPASHRWVERPDADELERQAEPLYLPAGSLLAFDGRLWHRERRNRSGHDVVLVTMQFVRPFMKPHFDYVRALGAGPLEQLPERTRYLLGSRTRIPESLEQFYLPPEKQLFRPLPE